MEGILASKEAIELFEQLQLKGKLACGIPSNLPPNDRAFLTGELYFRASRYSEIERDVPLEASEWFRRLAICTGNLFTSPVQAIEQLSYLEQSPPNEVMKLRLRAWRMHVLLLIGNHEQGAPIRSEIESASLEGNPFKTEILCLLAISYFSTFQCAKAISFHRLCLQSIQHKPEQYFQSLCAALGMRAALKICDPSAFDEFSNSLEESLNREFDARYKLRQIGYRAVILTQLGEEDLARRYWQQGDDFLEIVDAGAPTLERAQYLSFRCLAAALQGDLESVERIYRRAMDELLATDFFEVHLAEVEICRVLAPLANPIIRSKNISLTFESLKAAIAKFDDASTKGAYEAVNDCYREAAQFCRDLLNGTERAPSRGGEDTWKTLTVSIVSSYQNFSKFAERIEYFRLIPKFVDELQTSTLTDQGLLLALQKVLKVPPVLTENGFRVSFEQEQLVKISQVDTLISFANSLRALMRQAEQNMRTEIVADTVQMVAHDVRRPFDFLRMTVQTLSRLTDSEEVLEFTKESVPSILKVCAQVDRMLKEVKDAAAPAGLEKRKLETKMIVNTAIESLGSAADGVEVQTEFGDFGQFLADEGKAVRAVANVVENAVQATGDGKVLVYTTPATLEDRPALAITVRSMSFIPQEDHKRLFNKYFSKGKRLGTGLGLYIVKKIMDEHGGLVRCRSNIASGTEFDLVFPTR